MKFLLFTLAALTILACSPSRPEPPTPGPTPTKVVTYNQAQLDNYAIQAAQATLAAWPTPTPRIVDRTIVVTATPIPTVTPTPTPTPEPTGTPDIRATITAQVQATITAQYPHLATPTPPAGLPPTLTPTPPPTPFYDDLRSQGLPSGVVAYLAAQTGQECALPSPDKLQVVWSKADAAGDAAISIPLPDAPVYLIMRVNGSNSETWRVNWEAVGIADAYKHKGSLGSIGQTQVARICAADAKRGNLSLYVDSENAGWDAYVLANAGTIAAPLWAKTAVADSFGECGMVGLPPYKLSASRSSGGQGGGTQTWNVTAVKGWNLLLFAFDPEKPRLTPGKAEITVKAGNAIIKALTITGNTAYNIVVVCNPQALTVTWKREWGDFAMWTLSEQ